MPAVLGCRPADAEGRRRVADIVDLPRLAAGWRRPEPEADVPCLAGPLSLCEKLAAPCVQVVGRDPLRTAEVAADGPGIQVNDPGVLNHRQQPGLSAGE